MHKGELKSNLEDLNKPHIRLSSAVTTQLPLKEEKSQQ